MSKQEFLLGRGMTEPFKIEGEGVSAQHAKITVDSDDTGGEIKLTIEDLKSTNGTWVRDDRGQMIRIERREITPDTFIRLGGSDVGGCTFYARHLLSPNSYREEFRYMRRVGKDFREEIERVEQHTQRRALVTPVLYLIIFILSMVPARLYGITDPTVAAQVQAWMLRIPMMLGGLIGFFIATNNPRKDLLRRYELMRRCPNPSCHHTLSEGELELGQCSRCKAR